MFYIKFFVQINIFILLFHTGSGSILVDNCVSQISVRNFRVLGIDTVFWREIQDFQVLMLEVLGSGLVPVELDLKTLKSFKSEFEDLSFGFEKHCIMVCKLLAMGYKDL